MTLTLRSPDFTTARRIAQAINAFLGEPAARPSDNRTIAVAGPDTYEGSVVNLVTDIEQLRIEPDQPARVLIDEASGIIVMGENVRVSTVAIAQGNLTIRITETPQVSQPQPFCERRHRRRAAHRHRRGRADDRKLARGARRRHACRNWSTA